VGVDGWQWQLGIAGGATIAWALGLALLALWVFELRSIRGESDRRRRATLGVLGGLGILGVYLLALQITLVRETFEEVAGGTAVLVDSSRSMTLSGSGGARDDAVRSLIGEWQQHPRRRLGGLGSELSTDRRHHQHSRGARLRASE
jgi:hypothetical protein